MDCVYCYYKVATWSQHYLNSVEIQRSKARHGVKDNH